MKKHIFGRQLSRDINERKALFKGLIESLVMEESITTTEAKARSIRGQVEKLITKAKRKGPESKRLLQPWFHANAMEKVMSDLAVRFAERPGGYTRIIKLGTRFGDNASMAVIEFVEKREKVVVKAGEKKVRSQSVRSAQDKSSVQATKTEKVEATGKSSSKQIKTSSAAKKELKPTRKPTKDSKRKEATAKKNTKKG